MMKAKIILPFLGASVLALISVYFYLGGFKPIELKLDNCSDLNLVGVDYRGIPQDDTIGEYFREVEAARKNKPLHTIYYIEPEGKRDSLHVFIGYESEVMDQNGTTPWTRQSVECQQVIVATLKMNRFVMPGPDKTKKAIQAFAQENDLTLNGIFIDKIISSNHVEVWAPVGS
ncbi:hypothetical protein [Cyclobacterium qasimii]|uniref:Uncharacterized protein n=2 Tax=Cyclobacterium qasimii TaxID=1350429 RepID=S7VDB0_9BACT|nr:hypothetical protein [Cyclobacterium qasimii]EPR67552.1 hypothetical protein ADICYQ_3576 [Cyclobacterium qasimii M12-11B]GEO21714.1 hypothetical protein CQA01_22480 [Cyclobacterium qasimii]